MDTGQSRGQREGLGVLGDWREAAEQGSGPALMLPSAEEVEVVSHVPVTLERPFIPGLGSWPCPLPPPPPPALLTFFFLIAWFPFGDSLVLYPPPLAGQRDSHSCCS